MSKIDDFFSFRLMITPVIIQILFWLGVILSLLVGGVFLISSLGAGPSAIFGVFYGLVLMLAGPIVVRTYCELLIVFFRMNETLTEIKKNTNRLGPAN